MKEILELLTKLEDDLEKEYDYGPDLKTCRRIEDLFDEVDSIAWELEQEILKKEKKDERNN